MLCFVLSMLLLLSIAHSYKYIFYTSTAPQKVVEESGIKILAHPGLIYGQPLLEEEEGRGKNGEEEKQNSQKTVLVGSTTLVTHLRWTS